MRWDIALTFFTVPLKAPQCGHLAAFLRQLSLICRAATRACSDGGPQRSVGQGGGGRHLLDDALAMDAFKVGVLQAPLVGEDLLWLKQDPAAGLPTTWKRHQPTWVRCVGQAGGRQAAGRRRWAPCRCAAGR